MSQTPDAISIPAKQLSTSGASSIDGKHHKDPFQYLPVKSEDPKIILSSKGKRKILMMIILIKA